jgi:hypothetical protein
MRRRGRRSSVVPHEGDRVIDAQVHARLLGLPLLRIDAHVVVGPARPPIGPSAAMAERTEPALPPVTSDGAMPPGLAQAVRLLDEGSSTLDDARSIRHDTDT